MSVNWKLVEFFKIFAYGAIFALKNNKFCSNTVEYELAVTVGLVFKQKKFLKNNFILMYAITMKFFL